MGRNVVLLLLVAGLAGCAGGGTSGYDGNATLYPINAAAKKYGVLRTVIYNPGDYTASFNLVVGRETFEGQAMTIDNSYTGWGNVFSYGNAVAFSGGMSASVYGAASSSSRTTVRSNALRGIATGYSSFGRRVDCEYVLNNLTSSATGVCRISDGALFRLYAGAH